MRRVAIAVPGWTGRPHGGGSRLLDSGRADACGGGWRVRRCGQHAGVAVPHAGRERVFDLLAAVSTIKCAGAVKSWWARAVGTGGTVWSGMCAMRKRGGRRAG